MRGEWNADLMDDADVSTRMILPGHPRKSPFDSSSSGRNPGVPNASEVPDLRAPSEHFDQVIVKVVVKLPLKIPFERSVLELAGSKAESVRVVMNSRVFQ
jgi:hypothetical protein